MKRSATVFLQVVTVLVGLGALALLLWEPQIEGRNANATIFQIYFNDPFLAYVYAGSIPFFVALHQAFQVLGYAGRNQVFAAAAVKSLRTIKYSALATIALLAGAEVFLLLGSGDDDRAGGVIMGIGIAFAFIVVAAGAATFERILQSAVELKSETDLTV